MVLLRGALTVVGVYGDDVQASMHVAYDCRSGLACAGVWYGFSSLLVLWPSWMGLMCP